MVDVLWSLPDLDTAGAAKAAYGELGVEWLECPLIAEDLDGHVRLQRLPGAPIALGEHFHSRFDSTPWLERRALDVFQPDIGRTGISDGLRQISRAERAGIAVTPHMGSGLDVFQAATLQVAALCPARHLSEFQAGLADRLGDALDSAWHFVDGSFRLPEVPGIGVTVDEAALRAHVVTA
jgi:galactonate dehydratase